MPLPTSNIPWPPAELAPALDGMRVWDAWWAGDTDELADVYKRGADAPRTRTSQYAGGVVGAAARMWWGKPQTTREQGSKLHVPLASDICRASADLLFSEPISATADDKATTDALDEFLGDGTIARLLEAAETTAALGGGYLRVAHNREHFDDAWFDVIAPDAGLPEWVGGRLVAVTLWWVVSDAGEGRDDVWRHLERHDRGFISHGLYRGTRRELGRAMPLEDHPSTEALAPLVDEFGRIETGHPTGLDIVYVPNMRPNRKWRRDDVLAPMGRSDLDGIEPVLDALDETWSSWMRDIRLAKGRVIAPESYLDNLGPGKGAMFDADREVYAAISDSASIGGGNTGPGLTVVQFDIRVGEHSQSSAELVAVALRTSGYSAQTFGEVDQAAATATEVVARERRSYITRGKKIAYWRPELVDLLIAWLAIRAFALGQPALDPAGLSVSFPDAVSEDMAALATTVSLLKAAESASIETRVRMLWPEADDAWVAAEVLRIQDEGGPAITLPTFGTPDPLEDDPDALEDDPDAPLEDDDPEAVPAV